MQINFTQPSINFKGATINIGALSDTHGHIEKADSAFQALMKQRAFEKETAGKINYLITGGDWFISGDKKGYKSAPDKPLMQFQLYLYNKFVSEIKKRFPKLKTLFIPGNHEFDGGSDLFQKTAANIDSTILASNMDMKKSTLFQKEIDSNHIVEYTVDFVQDDKCPHVSYPIMNLGVVPVNMNFYSKKTDGMTLTDNIPQAQKTITFNQYKKTFENVISKAKNFKEKYPDGIVILTSHTGVDFAENCAKEGLFDIIFNGHEHKNYNAHICNTPIINLSQNFDKLVNAKIKIGDDGKREMINIYDIVPNKDEKRKSAIGEFFDLLFKEDSKKIYTIKCTDKSVEELSTDGIRKGNNYLANFVTDVILSSIREKDPKVDIFALNSSAIRGGFDMDNNNPSVSNVDVMNCLDGINVSQADVYTTDVTGRQLIDLIMDNYKFNLKDREKNPIIHYAGIKVDRTNLLKNYKRTNDNAKLCPFVILSKTGKSIKPDSVYRIANPIKYFEKAQNKEIKNLLSVSKPLNGNVVEMFNEYFDKYPTTIYKPDVRIY